MYYNIYLFFKKTTGRTEHVRVFAYELTICNKMRVKNYLNKKLFEAGTNQRK